MRTVWWKSNPLSRVDEASANHLTNDDTSTLCGLTLSNREHLTFDRDSWGECNRCKKRSQLTEIQEKKQ